MKIGNQQIEGKYERKNEYDAGVPIERQKSLDWAWKVIKEEQREAYRDGDHSQGEILRQTVVVLEKEIEHEVCGRADNRRCEHVEGGNLGSFLEGAFHETNHGGAPC